MSADTAARASPRAAGGTARSFSCPYHGWTYGESCQLGHRTDAATNQGVEAAAGSLDFIEQHRIGIGRPRVGCIDGEPHLHPAALDPQRKLLGEDATLQSVRGRCGRPE